MSITRIKVENLAKQYRLGEIGTGTISHDLNRWWANLRGKEDPFALVGEKNDRTKATEDKYVWALKDINFEVKEGEVLGIIGRNGAGKSTLLKILSKVTGPSKGQLKINGRIGALLEVGTGMHPELTGIENIYLNGAILGMTKREIKVKLDEIIDFAGITKYANTPFKRYSSGMRVRLGFAVAAFLEPEILIVDEVLAVGDAEFQKKAIGKMKSISEGEGRTVLFVSHNMTSIRGFCNSAILLENGQMHSEGKVDEIIKTYFDLCKEDSVALKNKIHLLHNENIRILDASITPFKGDYLTISSGVAINIEFFNNTPNINLAASVIVKTFENLIIAELGCIITENNDSKVGTYTVSTYIPANILNAGDYYINLLFGQNQRIVLYSVEQILTFKIQNEKKGNNFDVLPGVLSLNSKYNITFNK